MLGFAVNVVGLVAADALSEDVTARASGTLLAAAVIEVLEVAYNQVFRSMLRRSVEDKRTLLGCAGVLVMFAGLLVPLAFIVVASRAVPGFEVYGLWAYALTFACLWAGEGVVALAQRFVSQLRAGGR